MADDNQTINTNPTDPQDQVVTEQEENTNITPNESEEAQNESGDSSAPEPTQKENPQTENTPDAETEENAEPPVQKEAVSKTPVETPAETEPSTDEEAAPVSDEAQRLEDTSNDDPNAKWYVVHTYSGHENKVATALKQRVESEHLEHKILDVIVPTQDKIEIRSGKKSTVKEKIFPGYILVKMVLDDNSWLAVRTTQGVTSFVGIGNKPTPIPEQEVKTIVKFMTQGAAPTFKDVYMVNDTVKITDGPFSEFIGKVDSVDKEHGKVRVLVSIFGRETPVELDFLQVQKL